MLLVALLDGMRVDALTAAGGLDYLCPECRAVMTLRRGRIRVPHFAHRPPVSCSWGSGETAAHMEAKRVVAEALQERGLRAELEYVIAGLSGDRRADVAVWSPKGRLVAIELQHTPIDLWEIERRSFSYASAGVPQFWIPFLRPLVWETGRRAKGGWFVERYPARPFERWIKGLTMRAGMWMYDPREKSFWLGTMADHMLHHEGSSWYDSDGEEQSSDDYDRPSKRYKELSLKGPYAATDLAISVASRKAFAVPGYRWPAGVYATFVPRP